MGKSTKQNKHEFDDDWEYEDPTPKSNKNWKKQEEVNQLKRQEKDSWLNESTN